MTVTINDSTVYHSNGTIAKFPRPPAKTLQEMNDRRMTTLLAERILKVEGWL